MSFKGSAIRVFVLAVAMVMMASGVALAQAPPAAPPPGQAPPPGGPPAGGAAAAANAMKAPFAPFHIIGNIYYIGSAGLACYLITTPAGNILLDTGYPDMASQIEGNIKTLGFKLEDTKILINSHAHIDHGGGMAEFKTATGGQLVAMAQDAPYFESGGHNDVMFGDRNLFPPVHVDRVIHDGDTVTLGGTTLTAHLTPGHTPGNTTWTMVTQDKGRSYNVVFFGIVTPFPNTNLAGSPAYPTMGADWAKTMQVLPTLKCDVFLGSNAAFFDMPKKHDALMQNADPNPFIDPAGCKAFVDRGEATYQKLLTNPPPAGGPGPGGPPPAGAPGAGGPPPTR
ncbi:MAG TPA: subclass B3 metallo-beta-lactamase [Candidatus Acidoferrales bacterium]|nr:subclass B3 metallo-beta-lactamase [Candidatus Acidoferrales bacterium]